MLLSKYLSNLLNELPPIFINLFFFPIAVVLIQPSLIIIGVFS